MSLILRLLGSLLLWASMACLVILIVLLPRDTLSHRVGDLDVMSYHFTWDKYKQNIDHFLEDVKTKKSIGNTAFDEPVGVELKLYFDRSIIILLPAMVLSIIAGVAKGVFDYRYRKLPGRIFGKGTTWLGQSVPDFFLIFLIQTFLSVAMDYGFPRLDMFFYKAWYTDLFPISFLAMYPAVMIAKYTSQALEEEEEQDYIHTAKAKGVPDRVILWRHMLKNCFPKLLQHYMPIMLTLFSSMFVVEFLCLYHGIGWRLVTAIHVRSSIMPGQPLSIDVPAVIGFSLLFMVMLLVTQWVGQILQYAADPKRRTNIE